MGLTLVRFQVFFYMSVTMNLAVRGLAIINADIRAMFRVGHNGEV